MRKGQQIEVEILRNGKPTGEWWPGEVREVRRNHVTQEVQSVRVAAGGRVLWVQAQYVRSKDADASAL